MIVSCHEKKKLVSTCFSHIYNKKIFHHMKESFHVMRKKFLVPTSHFTFVSVIYIIKNFHPNPPKSPKASKSLPGKMKKKL
jgi:hypothetical protein